MNVFVERALVHQMELLVLFCHASTRSRRHARSPFNILGPAVGFRRLLVLIIVGRAPLPLHSTLGLLLQQLQPGEEEKGGGTTAVVRATCHTMHYRYTGPASGSEPKRSLLNEEALRTIQNRR